LQADILRQKKSINQITKNATLYIEE